MEATPICGQEPWKRAQWLPGKGPRCGQHRTAGARGSSALAGKPPLWKTGVSPGDLGCPWRRGACGALSTGSGAPNEALQGHGLRHLPHLSTILAHLPAPPPRPPAPAWDTVPEAFAGWPLRGGPPSEPWGSRGSAHHTSCLLPLPCLVFHSY